ncbi:hypothetical protein ACWDZ4_17715 [Streptomyces sp. NPDC003016]
MVTRRLILAIGLRIGVATVKAHVARLFTTPGARDRGEPEK